MSDPSTLSRRSFLAGTAAAAAATGLIGATSACTEEAQDASPPPRPGPGGLPARPNVLLVLVDEMRYPPVYEGATLQRFRRDHLVTEGALRANGVELHRHYVASTACAPSRASLFTGHYPSLHGVSQVDGAAKTAFDPEVYWLDPNGVPTVGDYFQAAGYRSYYRGKWHISEADLLVPGTRLPLPSYTDTGERDMDLEQRYQDAERLAGFGFDGWIGPEAHGPRPLNSASSVADGLGRDQGFAAQTVELIEQLDTARDTTPWFTVCSFLNPHDIALWGFAARQSGGFDFTVDDDVPTFDELFDTEQFARTLLDDLATKPSCQESYRASYHEWQQGVPPAGYFRLYYHLHKAVDAEIAKVYEALQASRFADDTIVVYTSDHGELLGAHRYMHQKWHQAYDEALRVPFIVSHPSLTDGGEGRDVHSVTSHVDLLPTLLGLAGIDPADHLDELARDHSDAVAPVGRDLTPLLVGEVDALADPIFFMTDDEPSRGSNQENVFGLSYVSIAQPNHIETVVVELDGEVWKYSRYFDDPRFWSDPTPPIGDPRDVVVTAPDGPDVPGEQEVTVTRTVKTSPEPDEHELYNVTADPMELANLVHDPAFDERRAQLAALLDAERDAKRLTPTSAALPLS